MAHTTKRATALTQRAIWLLNTMSCVGDVKTGQMIEPRGCRKTSVRKTIWCEFATFNPRQRHGRHNALRCRNLRVVGVHRVLAVRVFHSLGEVPARHKRSRRQRCSNRASFVSARFRPSEHPSWLWFRPKSALSQREDSPQPGQPHAA